MEEEVKKILNSFENILHLLMNRIDNLETRVKILENKSRELNSRTISLIKFGVK